MKKSRYSEESEEQVIGILREGESGTPVKTVCSKHNISEATYYAWKRKYGGKQCTRLASCLPSKASLLRLLSALPCEI